MTRRPRRTAAPVETPPEEEPTASPPEPEPVVEPEPEPEPEPAAADQDDQWAGPGGALRKELWIRGRELFDNLARLNDDDMESAVHDVRVASRRLASILGLAAELIGKKPVRAVREELSNIRRSLGECRDLEVQEEFLTRHAETHPAMAGRLEQLRKLQPKALKRARKALGRVKASKLARRLEGIDALVAALVEHSEGWHECLAMLSRAAAERFVVVLTQRDQTNPHEPASLHQLRIAFKKFRYRAEVVGQLEEPPRPTAHAESMKAIQKSLGSLQDLEVITRGLEAFWWEHPPERGAQLDALGDLLAQRNAVLTEFFHATAGLDQLWHLPVVAAP